MKRGCLGLALSAFLFCGCSVSKYTSVTQNTSFDKYSYVYVTDASTITTTKTANPADIIAGNLMKRGFVRVPSINQDTIEKTMIVSYGESGRHGNVLGYATEVTLQFLDAKTMEIIATTTAAGMGETEADDVKKAIKKCFQSLFPQ